VDEMYFFTEWALVLSSNSVHVARCVLTFKCMQLFVSVTIAQKLTLYFTVTVFPEYCSRSRSLPNSTAMSANVSMMSWSLVLSRNVLRGVRHCRTTSYLPLHADTLALLSLSGSDMVAGYSEIRFAEE
jgi:hypothetical protein